MTYDNSRLFAHRLDEQDFLADYRDSFHYPKNKNNKELIYFGGNSLGLQPKTVSDFLNRELLVWSGKGVLGQE